MPLVGATLLPAAIYAGLPAMGAAVAIAIAGQGMALSSDYVIRVGRRRSAPAPPDADSAGIIADKALVLSLVTGRSRSARLSSASAAASSGPEPAPSGAVAGTGATLAPAWPSSASRVAPSIGSFDKSVMALRAAEGLPEARDRVCAMRRS